MCLTLQQPYFFHMSDTNFSFLEQINLPEDLKKRTISELPAVCDELRRFIIDAVSVNPGHFGASLGVVELTVALHYVCNTPYDRIIWDVGHQAYSHKILTGRRNVFHSNRKYKGISGFPKVEESPYDAFGTGHSSTSVSAALGMAVAASLNNDTDRKIVAVIGDGALTGGMAFEALNHAGTSQSDLLVILNDNQMAIDASTGALSEYLLNITTSRTYNRMKSRVWNFLGKVNRVIPNARRRVQTVEHAFKSMLLKRSNVFEALKFRYFGPIDGHDVEQLVRVLTGLRDIPGPKLLHCITVKGKGFKHAELDQTGWHAPGLFDKHTGEKLKVVSPGPVAPRFQDVFGYTLIDLARQNPHIVGVTPAMPTGCSMNLMMKEMPDRAFDVGIAEQHAVTFSAGLAKEGKIPFCNIYSSFMQRAFDQVIHDVALQKLQVVFCLDRGGIVGEDGATHQGVFDLAYMRMIPNMIVAAPIDEAELRNMMYTAQLPGMGPFSIRYPRGRGHIYDWQKPFTEIRPGTARKLADGTDLAVLSIGTVGLKVRGALEILKNTGLSIAHYDMRFAKPIDKEALSEVMSRFSHVLTVEDGVLTGGFGSAVLEFFSDNGYTGNVRRLGVPDKFIEHGSPDELYRELGLDATGIAESIQSFVGQKALRVISGE